MNNLTIYRASAGSGKTFTIVENYLKLILAEDEEGFFNNYKSILAVTFTNKATEEMKGRIIEELSLLARNGKSSHIEKLCKDLNISTHEIVNRSKVVLRNILHDYSRFSISTIDSFFQKILKSFAKELGLSQNFEDKIDTNSVAESVVDEMLSNVVGDSELLKNLVKYSQNKIENGKNWNIKDELINFTKKLFKEEFLNIEDELLTSLENISINDFIKILNKKEEEYLDKIGDLGDNALKIIHNQGLEISNFKRGAKGFASCFQKAKDKTLDKITDASKNVIDSPEAWYKKSDKNQSLIENCYVDLNSILIKLVNLIDNENDLIQITAIKKNIYQLNLISELIKNIKSYNVENNSNLLCYTPRILSKITNNNDTPFIYEKVGSYYKNYMIDEFQDTSKTQWSNFLPLLNESAAMGNENIIVGDIKQSIYSFRGGDWELMDSLIKEIEPKNLENNWRTLGNIINFNNNFYEFASQRLFEHLSDVFENCYGYDESIKRIYAGLAQKVPSEHKVDKGFIGLREFGSKKKSGKAFDEHVSENLINDINSVIESGYEQKDIAILFRSKKDEEKIVGFLNSTDYNFISEKSLKLLSSPKVKIIINLLKYIIDEKNLLAFKIVKFNLDKINSNVNFDLAIESIKENLSVVLDTVEDIIDKFEFNTNRDDFIYLQTLLDKITDFTISDSPSIEDFLDYWDSEKDTFNIKISDEQNAIKLLTIHKSKGLEFKVVFIPFCNWEFATKGGLMSDTYWLSSEQEPYNMIPYLPLNEAKDLLKTDFKKDYTHNVIKSYIESLNMLYVATTRPKEALYIYTPITDGISNVGSLLSFYDKEKFKDSDGFLTFGKLEPFEVDKKDEAKVFLNNFPSKKITQKLIVKKANDFFLDENKQLINGRVFHELFSEIRYFEDIGNIVKKYCLQGYFKDQKILTSEIESKIKASNKLLSWFSDKWEIKTEASILSNRNFEKRPDRIMLGENEVVILDYKFGKEEDTYIKQILGYKRIISKMGYKNIQGYLWYYNEDKLVEC